MLSKRYLTLYSVFVLLVSSACAVWRIFLIRNQTEASGNFNAVTPAVYKLCGRWSVLFWAAVLLCALFALFFIRSSFSCPVCEKTKAERIISLVGGILLCVSGAFHLVYFVNIMLNFHDYSAFTFFTAVSCFLMILSGLFYILSSCKKTEKMQSLAGLSFCPALWSVLMLILSYFNSSFSLDNPFRKTADFAFVGFMFFFLTEAKQKAEEPLSRFYPVLLLLTSSLGIIYFIPQTVTVGLWGQKITDPFPFWAELTVLPFTALAVCRFIVSVRNLKAQVPSEEEKNEKSA